MGARSWKVGTLFHSFKMEALAINGLMTIESFKLK